MGIHVSPEKRQMIGLTLSKVERRELSRTIRTTAVVEHDETLYTRVAPRFSGWVRQLYVNFTGAPVEKGAPLFSAYSPDLFAAENEYLVAFRAASSPTGSTRDSTNTAPSTSPVALYDAPLLQSARVRLQLLEVSDDEIQELEKRGTPSAEMLFRAPFSGHVLQKNAVQGQAFNSGDTLFEIADLSRVWLRTAIYEYEFPLVQVGQHATIYFPNLQHTTHATVTFIYPHFAPQTRRGEVRLELQNPNHLFRPDMWANVEIEIPLGEKLAVPASAVLDTGVRQIAFVQGNEQYLEPRVLSLGAKTSDYYEVIAGLAEGEQVVTRALFLIDSESQLKSAIAGMLPTPTSSPELPHTTPETSTGNPPATAPAATHQHQH
jgi:Cu(I)/Ag(I) efflux system membrane fusion protein